MKLTRGPIRCCGLAMIAVVVIASCGSAANPSPVSRASTSPTAVTEPSAPASASPPATSASWMRPTVNATLKTYQVVLSATVTGHATKIDFSVTSSGTSKAACSARKPDPAATWTCSADLVRLGVPPGKVSFSFDTTDASGTVIKAPDGPRTVTYAVPPPAPTGATYKHVKTTVEGPYAKLVEYRATWVEPNGYATRFRVYGLTTCPRESAANNGQPCVVSGTAIPTGDVKVIATLDGTKRSAVISWTEEGELTGPGPYSAYLVRASNQYGTSTYTILWSAEVCWPGLCAY
jgi:hypothetical protein